MASVLTNIGKKCVLNGYFNTIDEPTGFRLALCSATTTPTTDTKYISELTECIAGNGYYKSTSASGKVLSRSNSGWSTATYNATADTSTIVMKDVIWVASATYLPAGGTGARWCAIIDGTTSARVIAYLDLVSSRQLSVNQALKISGADLIFSNV